MKDKRNHHGAVDKPSSEQQFRKFASITFVVWNSWSCTLSASGSYGRQGGWQAGRQNPGKFRNFQNSLQIEMFEFSHRLTEVRYFAKKTLHYIREHSRMVHEASSTAHDTSRIAHECIKQKRKYVE